MSVAVFTPLEDGFAFGVVSFMPLADKVRAALTARVAKDFFDCVDVLDRDDRRGFESSASFFFSAFFLDLDRVVLGFGGFDPFFDFFLVLVTFGPPNDSSSGLPM